MSWKAKLMRLPEFVNSRLFALTYLPVHMDATQFELPPEPSLIYFYDPFDQFVMEPVIQNLNRSLEEHPRDLILLKPFG